MKKSDYRKFIIRGEAALNPATAAMSVPRASVVNAQTTDGPLTSDEIRSTRNFSDEGENAESLPTGRESGEPELLPILQKLQPIPPGQNDDFASMREAVTRRYRRLQEEQKPMPSLILIDGGIGQLHAAAQALEALQIINQPLASIAKKEEILYIYGREDEPCILDRHSPVLHLIQQVRDETHRFAVTFHRLRRGKRQTRSALNDIPGVGPLTARKLLRTFGSVANLRRADLDALTKVVGAKAAARIHNELVQDQPPTSAVPKPLPKPMPKPMKVATVTGDSTEKTGE